MTPARKAARAKVGRQALLVLGMHRSGTSLAAALLCTAGAKAPEHMMPSNEQNTTGYWEPWPLYRLNEELLAELGLAWDSTLTLPREMLRSPAAQRFVPLYEQMLREEYGDAALLCAKDPRNCRVLPVLASALDAEGIQSKYIIITRNPLEVADSLKQRDGIHWAKSVLLWLRHTLEAEEATRGQRRAFITYDQLMSDWRGVLRRIGSELDVAWPRHPAEMDLEFSRIISSDLWHHKAGVNALDIRTDVSEWVNALYQACIAASENRLSEAQQVFEKVRRDMAVADLVFEPLLAKDTKIERDLLHDRRILREQLADRERTFADLSAQRDAALHNANASAAELGHRQSEVNALNAQLAQRESALAESRAELETVRHERDATEREASGAASRLAERQLEIDALSSQIEESNLALVASQGELEATIRERDAARAEADAATTRLAERQSEVEALNIQIGERDAASAERRGELKTLLGERDAARMEAETSVARLVELQRKFETQKGKVDVMRSERDAAQDLVGSHVALIADQRSQIESLSAQIGNREAALVVARSELDAVRAKRDEVRAAREAKGERDALALEIQGRDVELAAARSEIAELSAQLQEREHNASVARTELDRLREDLRATATRIEEQDACAETQSMQGEAAVAAAREELDRVRAEFHAQAELLAAEREELATARRLSQSSSARAASKQAQIERLFDELKRRDAEISSLKVGLDEKLTAIAAFENECRVAQKKLADLRVTRASERSTHEAALSDIRRNAEDARVRAAAREQELNETLRGMRALVETKDRAMGEGQMSLNASEAQVRQLLSRTSELDDQLAAKLEELADRQRQDTALRRDLDHLRIASNGTGSEVKSLEADVAAARVVTEGVVGDLERTQRELALARSECVELRAANVDLESRLKTFEQREGSERFQLAAMDAARLASSSIMGDKLAISVATNRQEARTVPPLSDPDLKTLQDGLAGGLCDIRDWKIQLDDASRLGAEPDGPIGIFVHIYYESIAGEIAAAIKRIPFNYQVYVSTADEIKKATIDAAFAREGVGNLTVKVVPNIGRDIGPFLFGFSEEIRKHDLCLRLHSKRSSHSYAPFGTEWRRHLLRELLDSADRVEFAVDAFKKDPSLGMLIPNHWDVIRHWVSIGDNWVWLKWLLDRLSLSIDPGVPIDYPSGSMFWFRSAALEPLLMLNLTPQDFVRSNEGDRDSTLAHGVERAFLFVGAKAGFRWAVLPPCPQISEPPVEDAIDLVRHSGLFDVQYYLEKYRDIAASGDDPLNHFMRYGAAEHRNPSATFDSRFYARLALREFGWKGNPLVHYLLEGRSKGLPTSPPRREASLTTISVVDDLYAAYKRAERGTDYVQESFPLIRQSSIKMMAFYFPQFHPFAENDRFWGRGFTEWTNTTKAQPLFPGHYQPRLPGELGFYDTRVKDVLARQIELAKQYGIHGFCFHHYFFQSKPVMRAPYNQMLAHRDLDIPFCLHWANEPWTVRWDGLASSTGMLLDQSHTPEDDLAFFNDIAPALTDPRYITVNGRPLLVIYRPGLFPDMAATIERWRNCCARLGLKDPYLAVMQAWFEGAVDPQKYGFDAAIEYPPHNLDLSDASGLVSLYDRTFGGNIRDYAEVIEKSIGRKAPAHTWFRGIMPQWDCTPRRADPDLFVNCDADKYQNWLEELCRYTERRLPERERFIFINSWNEWAEGAYLEPDRRYGYAYLNATARALNDYRPPAIKASTRVLVAAHMFYLDLLEEFLDHFERIPTNFDLFLTISAESTESVARAIRTRLGNKVGKLTIRFVENVGRDGAPFVVHALPDSQDYDLCCWVHSKKSPYDESYAGWRGYLLNNLLGSPEAIAAVVDTFERDVQLGVLFPRPFPPVLGKMEWGSNFTLSADLLSRIGITVREGERPFFPQGMMFWFRPKALRPLLSLNLTTEDFIRDSGGALHSSGTVFDGTLSHALERIVCYVATAGGFTSREFLDVPYEQFSGANDGT